MERNYDEIISEMLRQIDRHSEDLRKQSEELTKQSRRSDETIKKSDALWNEQRQVNARLFEQIDGLEQRLREQQGINNQQLEMAVNTAVLLDRIIKRNELKS